MADPKAVIETLSEIHTFPYQDLSATTGRYARADAMFTEVNDDGEPPAFAGSSHRDFPFDFETVLGFYDPAERRITYFPLGITFVADSLKVPTILIERIVRYHEHAHALHHLGIKANIGSEAVDLLRANDESFRKASNETKEQIAQLATLVVIRNRSQDVSKPAAQKVFDHMLETFFMLMKRQSPWYQLPPSLRETSLPRLRDKLSLLLEMSDACMFPSADHIRRIID